MVKVGRGRQGQRIRHVRTTFCPHMAGGPGLLYFRFSQLYPRAFIMATMSALVSSLGGGSPARGGFVPRGVGGSVVAGTPLRRTSTDANFSLDRFSAASPS